MAHMYQARRRRHNNPEVADELGLERVLDKARVDLDRAHTEAANLGTEPEKNRRIANGLRKLIRQQLGPNINDLGGRLATGADAATVVASLLQSLQEIPFAESGRINADKLERAENQASHLAAALQKLQATIGEDDKVAVEPDVISASRDVKLVLQRCQTIVDDWGSDLEVIREELPRLKERILGWMTFAAITTTVLCVWVAISQISLFAHAWKWL